VGDVDQPARETRRDRSPGSPPVRPVEPPRVTTRDAASGEPAAGVTRRDAARDPAGPGPAGPGPGGAGSGGPLVRVPGALAERYTIIGEVPAHGAEADLLHVRDAAGTECVIKIFRAGFTADRTVWRKLPGIDTPYVVRIHDTGHAEGRDYEVMEYVPGGNLRGLISGDRPPATEVVAEVVAQLAAGLGCLHEAGIVHRDLKPENVLVRSARPVRLAITDFGLSKVIDQSVVFASSSRTLAYAAPESLSGQVSPARDWWSLGLIIRELLTGRAPFGGMSETAVLDHLATRPIDVDDIADSRMRLLCRGLLVRDPRRRWGAREVEAWLHGESPPVPEDIAVPGATAGRGGADTIGVSAQPLPFGGRQYHHRDRRELARALVADWHEAARHFFSTTYTPSGPSEAWRTLRGWLGGFGAPTGGTDADTGGHTAADTGGDIDGAGVDVAGRVELIDRHLAGAAPADVKLLHLVRWLDPELAPHYLGRRVLPQDLAGLVAIVQQDDHTDRATAARIGRDLWEYRLLPVLAGFSGGHGRAAADRERAQGGPVVDAVNDLNDIDARWRALVADWNRRAARLRAGLAATGARLPDAGTPREDDPPVVLLTLLALAARPARTAAKLVAAAAAARQSVRAPVEWYDRLADSGARTDGTHGADGPGVSGGSGGSGDGRSGGAGAADPLDLLAVICATPAAVAEAEGALRDLRTERQRAAERERHWAERERRRLAGRTAAITRAVLWSLPLLLLWFGGSWLVSRIIEVLSSERNTGSRDNSRLLALSLTLAGVAFVVELLCEVIVAGRQGGDYLPVGPWSWVAAGLRKMSVGLSAISRLFSSGARQLGSRGAGCLALVALCLPLFLLAIAAPALLALAPLLWLAVLAVAPVIHAIVAGVRLHAWRREHDRARDQTTGSA
jgi:hypothetical protein